MLYFGSVTIASGQSLSGAFKVGDQKLAGIIMPTAWDAANLTFQAAKESTDTFQDIYDDAGTELAVTAAAGHNIGLGEAKGDAINSFPHIKVRSGTAGTPVAQTAARTITLVFKK